jgi:LDH2 family malate/lactate/ureidoglycolate dehydrogenase
MEEFMAKGDVLVRPEDLQEFARDVFIGYGAEPEAAEAQADMLVWANLRGLDSHGVFRIPMYLELLDKGVMNAKPNIRVEKETPATILIEGDNALGPLVMTMAMRRVIEKARQVGIGWGLVRHTSHQGAMGYYTQMAAKEGMAGIAIASCLPNTAATGARAAAVHNSPIAIGVPARDRIPPNLDMATSVVAMGKVQVAADNGIPIPLGWALDKDGNPTTDPAAGVIMLPAGGPKGYGLALMFECLSSLMLGNPLVAPIILLKARGEKTPSLVPNGLVAAINISLFTDLEEYKGRVDDVIDNLKQLPREDGVDEILIPGEPEERVFQERSRNGVPLSAGTIHSLEIVAERFALKLPPTI